VELTVKSILRGQPVRNRDALATPEVLNEFEQASEVAPPLAGPIAAPAERELLRV
jgi:hypothetical protein